MITNAKPLLREREIVMKTVSKGIRSLANPPWKQ